MTSQKKNKITPTLVTIALVLGSILLLIYTYQDYSLQDLKDGLANAHFKWIFFAMGAHLINHGLRAYRWQFLLKKQDSDLSWIHTFSSEMSGFFANALGLRIGEIVRCQRLKKMQNIPMEKSFATVLIERITDIIFFLGMTFVISLLFFTKIKKITLYLFENTILEDNPKDKWSTGQIALAIICLFPLGFFLFQKVKNKIYQFIQRTIQYIKLAYKANTIFFWAITCCIWLFYFLLEYISLYALESTEKLAQTEGIFAGMVVFIVLNVSHIIPLSNGLGLYHALVIAVLTYFNIPTKDAQTYAIITHGIQTFNAFFFGGLCFIFTFFVPTSQRHNASLNVEKKS